MSLKVEVRIDVPESVRRGKPARKNTVLTLDDAALAALPEADRGMVASYLRTDGNYQQSGADAHLSAPGYSNSPPDLPEATLAGVVEGVRADVARREKDAGEKAAHEAREKADRRDRTLAVLRERKTETKTATVYAWRAGAQVKYGAWTEMSGKPTHGQSDYQTTRPDWPYYSDSDVTGSPEAVAWAAELEAVTAAARKDAEAKALAALEREELAARTKAEAEAKAETERDAWIAAHGSPRLKRMLAEDIVCDAAYRDERLAAERPGWAWSEKATGSYDDPRNPPDDAFDALDAARAAEPDAELKFWSVERDADADDDYDDEPRGKYEWRGYVAVAEYLDGREIVYGLPAEYAVK